MSSYFPAMKPEYIESAKFIFQTYNVNFQVPDSAGTANAIFTGVKTKFGVIGVDQSITRNVCDPEVYEKAKLKSILDWSAEAGKATGVISTARITHATPANLYASSVDRNWEADSHIDFRPDADRCNDDIAKQLVYSDIGKKTNVRIVLDLPNKTKSVESNYPSRNSSSSEEGGRTFCSRKTRGYATTRT